MKTNMTMEDRSLNEKESVELIARMIRNTQVRVQAGDGNIFLLWGYLAVAVSLVVYILALLGYAPLCFWLWFLLPVLGYPGMIYCKKKRKPLVTTYIDRIISYVWIVIGVLAGVIPIVNIFVGYSLPVLFLECLLINIGVTLTGLIVEMKPITVGGIIGLGFSFVFLLPLGFESIVLFAIMAFITLVIPGHLLNHHYMRKESKKQSDV